jgi:hypothetical protein
MPHRLSAGSIVLLLFILGSARVLKAQDAWRPDTQIGNFLFNMPNGWKRIDVQNRPELVPADLAKGSIALIDFLPAQELKSDLRSWFDAAWAQWQRQFKVVQAGEITPGHNPSGFDFLRIDARVSNPTVGYCVFVFVAAQVGNRVEAYYYLDNSGQYRYTDRFHDFEHSLQFASNPSARSHERENEDRPGSAAGLQGLYIGYKMRGMIGLRTHFEYFVFFPDGNVIRSLPEQGLDNFNFAKALRESRDYCGRYEVTGNQVAITWADNNVETATQAGTNLKIAGDSYFKVSRSDGLRLQGVYRREGADLAKYFIQFASDGHFAENGMLNLVAYRGPSTSPGSGTYSIGNNTLTLNYADGRKVALSFFVFPVVAEGQQPTRIHVNTYALVQGQ